MDEFARSQGFDPLDVAGWTAAPLEQILHTKVIYYPMGFIFTYLSYLFIFIYFHKGGHAIRRYFGGFKKAVQRAYPELTFPDKWLGKNYIYVFFFEIICAHTYVFSHPFFLFINK